MAGYLHKWFFWVANVEEPRPRWPRENDGKQEAGGRTRNKRHERFHAIRSVQSVWDRAAVGGDAGFMRAVHGIWLKQRRDRATGLVDQWTRKITPESPGYRLREPVTHLSY